MSTLASTIPPEEDLLQSLGDDANGDDSSSDDDAALAAIAAASFPTMGGSNTNNGEGGRRSSRASFGGNSYEAARLYAASRYSSTSSGRSSGLASSSGYNTTPQSPPGKGSTESSSNSHSNSQRSNSMGYEAAKLYAAQRFAFSPPGTPNKNGSGEGSNGGGGASMSNYQDALRYAAQRYSFTNNSNLAIPPMSPEKSSGNTISSLPPRDKQGKAAATAAEEEEVTKSAADVYGYGEAEPSPRHFGSKPTLKRCVSMDDEIFHRDESASDDKNANSNKEDQDGTDHAEDDLFAPAPLGLFPSTSDKLPIQRSASLRMPKRSSFKHRSSTGSSGTYERRRSSLLRPSTEIQIRLPNDKAMTRRTSIQFDDDVSIEHIAPVTELVEDGDHEKLWFQEDEYQKMKHKSCKLANIVDKKGGLEYWKHKWNEENGEKKRKPCIRGLEGFLAESAGQVAAVRYEALDSVLDEQEIQRSEDDFNDDALAQAYSLSTIASRIEATERAQEDEKEIEEYMKSTREDFRKLSLEGSIHKPMFEEAIAAEQAITSKEEGY